MPELPEVEIIRRYVDDALRGRVIESVTILLQVHDELVLEVVESELDVVQAILRESMEHVVALSVPLIIDIHWGRNWAEAK